MLPIRKKQILLDVVAETPEQAIIIAGNLLVTSKSVEATYVEAMLQGYRDLGSYIVLAPNIAIPHARPEFGVNEQCLAFVRLKTPLSFGHPQNDDVQLIIPIGGVDKNFHIQMLKKLSNVLMDSNALNVLKTSNDVEEIYAVLRESRDET